MVELQARIAIDGVEQNINGSGCDLLAAILGAASQLGLEMEAMDHKVQSTGSSDQDPSNSERIATLVKLRSDAECTSWGVSIHEDFVWSSLQAVSDPPWEFRSNVHLLMTTFRY